MLKQRLTECLLRGKAEGKSKSYLEWMRMGSLAFDSMSIKDNVKFDPHTNEIVGFEQGTLKEDVLLRELNDLEQKQSDDKKSTRPGLS